MLQAFQLKSYRETRESHESASCGGMQVQKMRCHSTRDCASLEFGPNWKCYHRRRFGLEVAKRSLGSSEHLFLRTIYHFGKFLLLSDLLNAVRLVVLGTHKHLHNGTKYQMGGDRSGSSESTKITLFDFFVKKSLGSGSAGTKRPSPHQDDGGPSKRPHLTTISRGEFISSES